MKAKFDVLLVAGMHRSGTSAMARLVGDIGYYLGDNLLSPNSDNPRGFYEDATLMQFNVDFLEKTTGDGYHGNIKSHISTIHNASGHFDNLGVQTYLTENGFLEKPFIFKDPRLCLTFPLWQSLLANMGKSTACLIPFRNPLEVARSLAKRDGFSLDYGLSLWFIYNVFLINSIADTPVCFVDYDDLINDSRAVAKTASTFVCADEFEDLRFVEDYQHKFLSKALRHHSETIDSLQKTCSKLPMVVSLYEDMKGLSKLMFPTGNDIKMVSDKYAHYVFYDNLFVTSSVSYQLFLDCGAGYSEEDSITITQPTSAADVSFSLPQAVSIQNIRLDVGNKPCMFKLDKAEVTYLNGKKGQLEFNGHNAFKEIDRNFIFTTHDPQLLFKCDKLITHVEFALSIPFEQNIEVMFKEIDDERTTREAEIRDIRNELVTTQSDLAAAYTEAHEMRGQLATAQAELEQTREDLAGIQRDLAAAYTETHGMQGQLAMAEDELEQTREDLIGVQSDLAAAYTEAHEMRGHLGAAQLELAQVQTELVATQNDLAIAFSEVYSARNVLESAQGEALALRSSLSWKITAPLRLGFDILTYPVRVINNFNMKRTLFSLRYSKGGAALYTIFVPESLKKFINARWAGGCCTQPHRQGILQQQVQSTEQTFAQPLSVNTIGDGREPRFEPDPAWYEEKNPQPIPENCPVKVIAFYLPQFHPIPENDEWWGEGFTEWTNVTKAKPLFDGHYQPRLPGAMGFYDLRLPDVLRKQAALAKEFGVHGFCFHYYDFAGKRLLEKPLDILLDNPDIDLPFCLCWANENWTRRWDGMDNEILISQEHSPEDDIRFLNDIQKYFDDPRYIKVEGKPFLIIYKASQFPDMAATISRWRDHAAAKGQGLYLVMAQTFGVIDPNKYGFDAAIDFPPHFDAATCSDAANITQISDNFLMDFSNVEVLFKNEKRSFTQYKTVIQNWDNTARKSHDARIISGITPFNFEKWLISVFNYTKDNNSASAPFAFVNAWNEWAEGTYLEPDRVYGYAYLNAVNRALVHCSQKNIQTKYLPINKVKVLFILHDCALAGAQVFALTLLQWFKDNTALDIYILALDAGVLAKNFSDIYPFSVILPNDVSSCKIQEFCNGNPEIIYANTVVCSSVYDKLASLNARIVTHVHELESVICKCTTQEDRDKMVKFSGKYIAASPAVKKNLVKNHGILSSDIFTVNAFIHSRYTKRTFLQKQELRKKLKLPAEGIMILGCGTRYHRKGTDIFYNAIDALKKTFGNKVFGCWIGNRSYDEDAELVALERVTTTIIVDAVSDPAQYFMAADIFALPSREDPFPLVCLEAADAGMPIVCFADAGGMPDFVELDAGFVVPYLDESGFIDALIKLVVDDGLREQMGKISKEKIMERHTDLVGGPKILSIINSLQLVSVIVPNYNKEKYLVQRLESIRGQTYKNIEVILLDDNSTDRSIDILEEYSQKYGWKLIKNTMNAGAFSQWEKGFEHCTSNIVWIAEADDYCDTNFLEVLVPFFADREVLLAHSKTVAVDENGGFLCDYSLNYLKECCGNKFSQSHVNSGVNEVLEALSYKNTIPNASAVVVRKDVALKAASQAKPFHMCGDWAFYIMALKSGKVAYAVETQTYHRRYSGTVTSITEGSLSYFQELTSVFALMHDNYLLPMSHMQIMVNLIQSESKRFNINLPDSFLKDFVYAIDVIDKRKSFPIAYILGDCSTGGAQMAAIRLANLWHKNGWPVIVINLQFLPSSEKMLSQLCKEIPYYETPYNASKDYVESILTKHKVEVVHTQHWWADIYMLDIMEKNTIPWVITMHGCFEFILDSKDSSYNVMHYYKRLMSRVSHWLYTAEKNLQIFKENHFPLRLTKIFNTIDLNIERLVTRESLGIDDSSFVFCIASRAVKDKGWDVIVEMTQRLVSNGLNVKSILVGEGEEFDRISSLDADLRKGIVLLGARSDVSEILNISDVALLPSRFLGESMPLFLIEALFVGKPIIATSMGDIKMMLSYGEDIAGFIVEKNLSFADTVDKFAEYAEKLFQDKEYYKKCSAVSKLAYSKFDSAKLLALLFDAYSNCRSH